jgi:hypothetical protein
LSKPNSGLVPSNFLALITDLPLPAAGGGPSSAGEHYGGEGLLGTKYRPFKTNFFFLKLLIYHLNL